MLNRITKKQFIFTGLALIIGTLLLALMTSLQFKMTSTDPSIGQVSVLAPYIDINFNKSLRAGDVKVTSPRSDIISTHSINDKTIRVEFKPQSLKLNQTYNLLIEDITSVNNKKIDKLALTFKARDIAFEQLSPGQKAFILTRQDAPNKFRDDPVFQHLPYGTLNYSLTAVIEDQGSDSDAEPRVIIQAKLLLSAADAKSDREGSIARYKEEVVQYLKSVGIDPAAYVIDYRVVEPSLF